MEAKEYFEKKTIKIFHNDSGIILLDSQRTLGQYITDFFHSSTSYSSVYNRETMEPTLVFNRRLDEGNVLYTHKEYYPTTVKNEIVSICRKIESSGDNHISESSQCQKDKYQMLSLIGSF